MSLTNPVRASSIRERTKSPEYAARALEAIVRIPLAQDPPQLLDQLMRATGAIGASASVYTAAIQEGGQQPSCFSLFASHPAFAQEQGKLGPLLHHPWFHFAQTHTTPGTDHQMEQPQGAEACAVDLARGFGFRSCLVVPTPASAGSERIEMLCLGSDREDDFDGADARLVRTLARSLAAELHDWLSHYLGCKLMEAARLQESDLHLLALQWQGLCTKEISQRTGLSMASVDSRFQRIAARLKCETRKAAAIRVAAYGLLDSVSLDSSSSTGIQTTVQTRLRAEACWHTSC